MSFIVEDKWYEEAVVAADGRRRARSVAPAGAVAAPEALHQTCCEVFVLKSERPLCFLARLLR